MAKYTVAFKIEADPELYAAMIEYRIEDLLKAAVLPTLKSELVPLSLYVKKARN